MHRRASCVVISLLTVAAIAAMGAGASPKVPVTTGPVTVMAPTVETKTFDPHNLPSPPPPVTEDEAAVCVGNSRCDISFGTETLYKRKAAGAGYESAVKVTSIKMKTGLQITIWLPIGASPWIKEHEETHRQIFEEVYATAGTEALAITKRFTGQTFTGTGKTTYEAEKNAVLAAQKEISDDYTKNVCNVWSRVNNLFDEITMHGMRSMPGARGGISAAKAKQEAFRRHAAEQAASQPKSKGN